MNVIHLKGHIITFTTWHKRQKLENRMKLEEEVKRLDLLHKTSPTQTNWNLLTSARSKLNLDYSEHVQKLIMFSRQRFYQYGNKPSHLLAYQLNCEQAERSIKAFKTTEGKISYDPVKINSSFKDFYENL